MLFNLAQSFPEITPYADAVERVGAQNVIIIGLLVLLGVIIWVVVRPIILRAEKSEERSAEIQRTFLKFITDQQEVIHQNQEQQQAQQADFVESRTKLLEQQQQHIDLLKSIKEDGIKDRQLTSAALEQLFTVVSGIATAEQADNRTELAVSTVLSKLKSSVDPLQITLSNIETELKQLREQIHNDRTEQEVRWKAALDNVIGKIELAIMVFTKNEVGSSNEN